MIEHASDLLIGKLPKSWHNPVVDTALDPNGALHSEKQRVDQVYTALGSFDQFGGVGGQWRKGSYPPQPILTMAEHAILLVELWPGLGQGQTEEGQDPQKNSHASSIAPDLPTKVRVCLYKSLD